MPAMVPLLRPPALWSVPGAGDEEAKEDGRTEEAGIPLGKGDSAGNGSPGYRLVDLLSAARK